MLSTLAKWGEKLAGLMGDKNDFGLPEDKNDTQNAILGDRSISDFLPYESFDSETSIFYNKKSIGFILEASPLVGANEEIVSILTSLITDVLPNNTDLQVILWGSPKIGEIVDAFQYERSKSGSMYEWLAQKRSEFLKKGAFDSLTKSGHYILRDFRLFIVISQIRSDHPNITSLLSLRDDISSSLKSINISISYVGVEDLLSIVNDIIHPNDDVYPTRQKWNPYDSLSKQLIDPECLTRIYKDKLRIENADYVSDAISLSVKEYPSSNAQWKMTDLIGQLFNYSLQIPCPFISMLAIRLIDQEKALFNSQVKTIRKEKTAKSPLAKFMPKVSKEYEDWYFVQSRVNDGDKLVHTYFQTTLFAKSENANNYERKIRDLYRASGWRLKKTCYLQLQSFLANLPMMMTEGLYNDMKLLGRLQTMTAFNAINVAPLQGEWKGTKTPSLFLPGRRGQITAWDPYDNEGNFNIAIMAAPRKGKSVFTQKYLLSILGSGGRSWVIDAGRSYQKTCKNVGGQFIEFTKDTHISLNPFTQITDIHESMELLKQLLSSMARPLSGASEEELSYIEKAIYSAWNEYKNKACITNVAKWLDDSTSPLAKNLAHLLYPYTQGSYAKFFEGDCTVNFNNRFIVIELQELNSKKDLQKIVLQLIIFLISQEMYHSDRSQKKVCVIDESWELFDSGDVATGKFIEAGYRKAPKYRGSFVSIAHSADDFLKNPMSRAAFFCSDFKIFFGQTTDAINRLKKSEIIDMDGYTERLFKSLKVTADYSECIIKSNEGITLHRVILDPYTRILFSTKGEEFDQVNLLESKGHTLMEAIEIVAQKYVL